jgi:peptidoglycan/LPS O-acetylase OafA/YrhL
MTRADTHHGSIGTSSGTYWPALDGLRAIAVVGVVLYHAGATSDLSGVAPGGFLGVSVFFTLSGFLVTGLLLRRLDSPGPLALGTFWSRRLKRLAPASLVVVAAAVLLSSWYWDGMQATDALAGTFGYTNWHVIWSGEDALLRTIVGPLGPFWSLAVEEQFYLLMTVAVVVAGRTARPVRTLAVITVAGWAASTALQLLVDWPQYRLEFGTDLRAAELLAGSGLALLLHRRPGLLAALGTRLQPVGLVALGVVVALAATTDYDPPWLLHGGYAALSLVNTVLVLSLLTPGGLTRTLAWTPLVAIGRLSYSWYLVHWPVILIVDRVGLDRWGLLVLKVGVSLVVAVALHRLVEQPLRRREPPRRLVVAAWATASALVAVLAVALL